MIKLFNIGNFEINTSRFDNLLHGKVVFEFERKFSEYVGAKYACSFSSASMAIFAIFKLFDDLRSIINIPTMIPHVVVNSIYNAGYKINFVDNNQWVGNCYLLHTFRDGVKIFDSAQQVERFQYKNMCNDNDIMIFSFYPTKPIGSCDGGMVVSNDMDVIKRLREFSINGTAFSTNSWDRVITMCGGWKVYMNSVQAYMASCNLDNFENKIEKLNQIRKIYNKFIGEISVTNNSNHLYRIRVSNNKEFCAKMLKAGIMCGIHYETLHNHDKYRDICVNDVGCDFVKSIFDSKTVASIPFHDNMSYSEAEYVVKSAIALSN